MLPNTCMTENNHSNPFVSPDRHYLAALVLASVSCYSLLFLLLQFGLARLELYVVELQYNPFLHALIAQSISVIATLGLAFVLARLLKSKRSILLALIISTLILAIPVLFQLKRTMLLYAFAS